MNVKFVPALNRHIKFVSRESLRHTGRKSHLNLSRLKGVQALQTPPVPEGAVDWSKKNTLSFPIDGNDQYGDCFYACACHHAQAMTGNVGVECSFDVQSIIKHYLALAGGDNGLSADQIYGEWKKGLCSGPHKILDYMPVSPTNAAAMKAAIYYFGGVDFTLGVPDAWLNENSGGPTAGMLWDAGRGVTADQQNGHAVYLVGMDANGVYQVETWGLNPPIRLTQAGVGVCDPEAFVVFSLDWFDENGVAPNGMTYDDLAALWVSLGGNQLPPSPFAPPPVPPTPPVPPQPPTPPLPPQPPVPPLPPVPPQPPTPTPTPAQWLAQFNQACDELLAILPLLPIVPLGVIHAIKWLQAEVNALFAPHGALIRIRGVKALPMSQIKQLADAILSTAIVLFSSNTQVVDVLTKIETVLDKLLDSLTPIFGQEIKSKMPPGFRSAFPAKCCKPSSCE